MPSALLPEAKDEVVEVFTGDTLEEAMAYAVATLGPDLTVRRARKVRKGVQGLRGKETYEVAAVPAPRASSEDAVEDAFASLLQDAESREEAHQPAPAPVRRTARPSVAAALREPSVPADSPPAAPAAVPEPDLAVLPVPASAAPAPGGRTARSAPARAAVPARRTQGKARTSTALATLPSTAVAVRRPTTAPVESHRAVAPPVAPGTPRWGRAELAALGLPRRVLDALPARPPRDDAAWIGALSKAFATVLPPPGAPDETHPVVVNGYGVEGVVGLLKAAAKGMTPGTITVDGRTAPATPTELALVVRAALAG